jgi:hypothetical protein
MISLNSIYDSLQVLIAQTSHEGEYNNATQYYKNNIVSFNGSSYMAKQDTKGNLPPTFPTTSNDYWNVVAFKGDKGATLSPKGAYNALTTYELNDLVNYNGLVWQCLQTSTGVAPIEGVNWTVFLVSGGGDVTHEEFEGLQNDVGDISVLTTTDKSSTVAAINENVNQIGNLSTTVSEHLSERMNVIDYGAIADWNGTTGTDNATVINNASLAASVNGGDVFFPKGVYRVASGLTLYSNVRLTGPSHNYI